MSIRINGNSGRKPQKITGPVDRDVKKVTEKIVCNLVLIWIKTIPITRRRG